MLEQQGYEPISERTFDSLFLKGWQVDGDESDSNEELQEAEPVIDSGMTERDPLKYDSDEDFKIPPEEPLVQKAEPLLDLSQVDPKKVNWFKYIVDKHLNDDSCLNSTDAYANLLQHVLSPQKDEEIQNELLDLVGFDNFELLQQLIEKRAFIKEYCQSITQQLQQDKQREDSYRHKNFDMPRGQGVGVSVIINKGNNKGKAKGKQQTQSLELSKGSNYDLLVALGFDKNLIAENKKLGLKERNMQELNRYVLEHAQQMKDGTVEIDYSKE
jgi:hypothetical protein